MSEIHLSSTNQIINLGLRFSEKVTLDLELLTIWFK